MNFGEIFKAVQFIVLNHKQQFRQDGITPFVIHPIRVASKVAELKNVTVEMIISALLHDVLEDCDWVKKEEIVKQFGDTVADQVDWLTKQSKKLNIKPRSARNEYDFKRLTKAPIEVKRIKLCDRIDNLSDLVSFDKDFINIYTKESELLLQYIGDADKELSEELKNLIQKLSQ